LHALALAPRDGACRAEAPVLFSTHHLLIITTALITDLGAVSCASCFLAARPHSTESRFLSVGTRRAAHRRRLPDADRATRSRAQVDDQKSELSKKISAKQEEIAARKANHLVSPYSKSLYQRVPIKALLGDDEGVATIGQKIVVGGWVKTGRTADKGSAPRRSPPPPASRRRAVCPPPAPLRNTGGARRLGPDAARPVSTGGRDETCPVSTGGRGEGRLGPDAARAQGVRLPRAQRRLLPGEPAGAARSPVRLAARCTPGWRQARRSPCALRGRRRVRLVRGEGRGVSD
jgi:hypothetical protein